MAALDGAVGRQSAPAGSACGPGETDNDVLYPAYVLVMVLGLCKGAQLARVELQEAFRGLIGRLPGLRLAVPASDLEFKPGMAIHSLRELPVLWGEP